MKTKPEWADIVEPISAQFGGKWYHLYNWRPCGHGYSSEKESYTAFVKGIHGT